MTGIDAIREIAATVGFQGEKTPYSLTTEDVGEALHRLYAAGMPVAFDRDEASKVHGALNAVTSLRSHLFQHERG